MNTTTNTATNASTEPSWRALADQHGGIWGEHPGYPLADWRYEVENNDTRLGYWSWIESQIESQAMSDAIDARDGSVTEPQTPLPELPVQFRKTRTFEVVVFETIKIKVTGITATSFAEATQKASEISANYRDFLSRRQPDGCIGYIEPAEEQAYYLTDLMDDDDIQESRWISGAWRLDAKTPTLEEVLAEPYTELPDDEEDAPPPVASEPNWNAPAGGNSVLKGNG